MVLCTFWIERVEPVLVAAEVSRPFTVSAAGPAAGCVALTQLIERLAPSG